MANKTVLLPREWNDPGVPPDDLESVIVKFERGYAIAFTNNRLSESEFYFSNNGQPIPYRILGWAYLIEQ